MRKSRTTRDAGLRQVSTATKWIAGAAAVLTGFITVWEARSVHDAAATPAVRQPAASSGSGSSVTSPSATDPGFSGDDLQAPDTAPAPSYQQPAASSGGS